MDKVTLMAVGDTAPHIEPPGIIFEAVKDVLKEADIRLAQVERLFSKRGTFNEIHIMRGARKDPRLISAYTYGGFDIVSLASNHSMDWGPEALVDTINNFRDIGIATIGVGANIEEARTPVILERQGVRVAFLDYCSNLLPQYWATENRPGVAPVRAYTYYRPYEYQPGSPAYIYTVAEPRDVDAMIKDIKDVRPKADVVVCCFHWGIHFVPRYHSHYEIEVGHAAIDAGCDLILGSHPHILRGIEVYKGKPIVYSLGNFAMSRAPGGSENKLLPEGIYDFNDAYRIPIGPDYTYEPRKEHYFKSVIAKADLSKNGNIDLSFMPVYIEDSCKPRVLKKGDSRFDEVVRFLQWNCEPFGTNMQVESDLLRVVI